MKVKTAHRPPHPSRRQRHLTAARQMKMARSAHAYVRGNTEVFYEWLDTQSADSLPEGPPIWICGDCHIGNLGPVANADGQVEFEIRDFDQTVIGNPSHDLIRLGLSLATAARGSDLPGVTTARMMEEVVRGYSDAFRKRNDGAGLERPESVDRSLKESRQRGWTHLAEERIAGGVVSLPQGSTFWPITRAERAEITALTHSPEVEALLRSLHHRDDAADLAILDIAYWKKGCSSLGRLRYAVLMDVEGAASDGRDMCLVDIKEAIKAVAPRNQTASMPRDNARRVVEGARAMSPFLGERMAAGRLSDRAVFVRELLPQDLKLEIEQLDVAEAVKAAYYLARVVGRAHARQMDAATRQRWRAELARHHSRGMDAPTWLWRSVIELVASHEKGYLEHCRRFSMGRR